MMRKSPLKNTEPKKKKREYIFKTNLKGQMLNLYARNPSEAKRKAVSWERWLKKTRRGNDKVVLSSIKEVKYDKSGNNPYRIKV